MPLKLEQLCGRDEKVAVEVKAAARGQLQDDPETLVPVDFAHGVTQFQYDQLDAQRRERASLSAVADNPFQVMAEMIVEAASGRKRVVWYGNEKTTTNLTLSGVTVMSWTHPALQVALTSDLNEQVDLKPRAYTLRNVTTLARARFKQVLPRISGIYEPGGAVNTVTLSPTVPAGLKAVKLNMTRDQVTAFIHRMNGFMLVSGAPGTGKTTVALQRIRFLFDQQTDREDATTKVPYAPELTLVFLANQNLLKHARHLLDAELAIPPDVIHFVPEFIDKYLDRTWTFKNGARPIQRKQDNYERRAREAFFNLLSEKVLPSVWRTYEEQILQRLKKANQSEWIDLSQQAGGIELAAALTHCRLQLSSSPIGADVRMDEVYRKVRAPYEKLRQALREHERDAFDASFLRWIFTVYDPFDAVETYFSNHLYEGEQQIKAGTVGLRMASDVVKQIRADWHARQFGTEERSWFAWLLRFVLPEQTEMQDRFRQLPAALPEPNHRTERRFTQVVIDEAQDLAVQEASFLGSLVHPRGSLTVSADFHQIVSPVHGMESPTALRFGLSMPDDGAFTSFPFAKNMRQSWEIGTFVKNFYQHIFSEFPPFDAADHVHDSKPQLLIGPRTVFAAAIAQIMRVFRPSQSIRTVALLQVNDDPLELQRLRDQLVRLGVAIATPDIIDAIPGQLTVTTVERAKGLEFDACVIIGLDDVERASLNYAKNRVYVAVSRPARRLLMLCEQFPPILHNMDKQLYERRNLQISGQR